MIYGDVAMVAQSEHDMLTIARALVGEVSPAAVSSLLRAPRALPPKIGPTAMGILEQTLSRGVVRELARRGGWQKSRMGAEGRLWERHRPIALHFSPITIEILRWLSSAPLGESPRAPAAWTWSMADATLADELMLYLAADLLDQAEAGAADFALVARSPLSWLGFAGRLVRAGQAAPPMVFDRWVEGDGAVIFEALGPDLCRRWVTMEQGKRAIVAVAEMIALGAAQGAALDALFTAADRAGRRDLCSFVVDAAAALLDPGRGPTEGNARPPKGWYPSIRIASALVKNLAPTGPMRERSAAWRAAGALLRALGTIKRWDAEHRARRFFDDDYESAQRLLARWEALGTSGIARSEQILKELESLDATITEAPKQGSKS